MTLCPSSVEGGVRRPESSTPLLQCFSMFKIYLIISKNMSVGYPEKRLQNVQVMSYDGKDFNPARLVPPRNQGQDLIFTYFQGSWEQTCFLREEIYYFHQTHTGFYKNTVNEPLSQSYLPCRERMGIGLSQDRGGRHSGLVITAKSSATATPLLVVSASVDSVEVASRKGTASR